jgi:hypothetical protein
MKALKTTPSLHETANLAAHRSPQNSAAHIPTIFFERTPEDPLEPDFERKIPARQGSTVPDELFETDLLEDSCLIKAPMPPMSLGRCWTYLSLY